MAVSEKESSRFFAQLFIQWLQIFPELLFPIPPLQVDTEYAIASRVGSQSSEGLLATAPEAHQQGMATRETDYAVDFG
jgi:hypothetical protein